MTTPDNVAVAMAPPRAARGTAVYTVRRMPPSTTVVEVYGQLDAANARQFSGYAVTHLAHTDQLIVDLTGVEFFGTEAFSMLHTISVTAAGKDARWVLVPSAAVRRLLQICDPDGVLPTAENPIEAAGRLQGHPLLQLVPQFGQ
ncbi:STAS domain-containing protein [Mycolicibacterium sp. 22603]|uniref:STAS domain-containing protein n=1 Tax=Mycolicibacterium sp. 22603 TaxID=3453950 RepID=UPI003F82A9CC